MLLKIKSGGVPTYPGGQRPLIYFVSSVQRVAAAGLNWVCADGNCAHSLTSFYADLGSLERCIDWPVMDLKYWNDTAEHPDRMRRRMAEFLIHQTAPLDVFVGIGTYDDDFADQVRAQLGQYGRTLQVAARPDWYY